MVPFTTWQAPLGVSLCYALAPAEDFNHARYVVASFYTTKRETEYSKLMCLLCTCLQDIIHKGRSRASSFTLETK